MKFLHSVMVNR